VQVGDAQAVIADAIAKVDAYQLRIDSAEAAVRSSIRGVNSAIDTLIATDNDAEETSRTRNQFQLETSGALLAQALRINSKLLSLVQ